MMPEQYGVRPRVRTSDELGPLRGFHESELLR